MFYRIDLPADDGGLVSRVLHRLAAEYNDDSDASVAIVVDCSCINPARITKLYGTLVCKGDSTADRSHRFAKILNAPEAPLIVTREQLEELGGIEPPRKPTSTLNGHGANGTAFDVAGFIDRNGLDVSAPGPWQGGTRWELNTSPMCNHGGDGPYLLQHASGAISAGCHHNSCKNSWGWRDLRA